MRSLALTVLLLLAFPAAAVIETYEFDTPQLELRYHALSEELRCPKCQNQNIAASNAEISQDLREQLHEQLQSGKSDAQIKDYMVQRYGEFVLYRPRWSAATALLWLAPGLLLLGGFAVVIALVRRSGGGVEQTISAEEQARLDALLSGERDHD